MVPPRKFAATIIQQLLEKLNQFIPRAVFISAKLNNYDAVNGSSRLPLPSLNK